MDSLVEAMRQAATKQTQLNEQLNEIFVRHFKLRPEDKKDVGYLTYGTMAVDAAVVIANIFLNIKHNRGSLNILRDLTFTLNGNKFWQQAQPVLIPVMQAAVNAQTDALFLQAETVENTDYHRDNDFIIGGRVLPLEIFPMIAFMLDGPQLMQECSIALKRELAPYFLS